jgi:hypothetical protein
MKVARITTIDFTFLLTTENLLSIRLLELFMDVTDRGLKKLSSKLAYKLTPQHTPAFRCLTFLNSLVT